MIILIWAGPVSLIVAHSNYVISFCPSEFTFSSSSSPQQLAELLADSRLLRRPLIDRLESMSFMKGDLLSKTRKLVKGFAKSEPLWLKAMEKAPPATFPRAESKVKPISFPEDTYVNKFFQKHPDSKFEDAIKISGFNPPSARVFAWRVLELKEQGVADDEAMAVADMEYRAERKSKKKAYARLKQIARLQGKRPPPNPYPSAIKEIQAEERKFVRDRFNNPDTFRIVNKLKQDKAIEMIERRGFTGQ